VLSTSIAEGPAAMLPPTARWCSGQVVDRSQGHPVRVEAAADATTLLAGLDTASAKGAAVQMLKRLCMHRQQAIGPWLGV